MGQPRGLGWLILAEGLASLSSYGMRVLLILALTREVLPGGRAIGLGPLTAALGHPPTIVALAAAIVGLFSSLNYLTPLAGGLLADRWLGRTRAIGLGALLIVMGLALMTAGRTFLLGLGLVLAGVGALGGALTAQVGALYDTDDPRRGDGFQLYYLAVDAGAIVAPLICGTIGESLGFGWGFVGAAMAMLLALAAYLAGRRTLPPDPPLHHARDAGARPPIGRRGWAAVAALVLLIPVIGAAGVVNNQIYAAYELWGDAHYDLMLHGRRMPVTWLISIDAFISFACGFVVLALWRWCEARGRLPSEIARCGIGALLSASAAALLALASLAAGPARLSLGWALGFHLLNNLGVAMLFPLTLALFSRAAPPGLAATMINASKLNFVVSFAIVGRLGGLVDRIDGAHFWLIHAGIVFAAGIALLAAARLFGRLLAPIEGA